MFSIFLFYESDEAIARNKLTKQSLKGGTFLLEQKPLIEGFLAQGPRPLSSFSFAAMFGWCDFFDFETVMLEGCLCVFAHQEGGCFLYLPPLGKIRQASTLQLCFERMAANSRHRGINRIENIPENLLSCFPGHAYNQNVKPAEYVYHKSDVAALAGTAYKSQRHDCNHFRKRHAGHTLRPYVDEDFSACLALYEGWAAQRKAASSDEIYKAMLDENRKVHARLLGHWQVLGLTIRVLEVGQRLVGYTFGYALDDQTFCVYAEIADLTIVGAAAFLFSGLCSDGELQQFEWVNAMDDFAMPNVARSKQAWQPARLVCSYSVSLK